MKTIYILLFSFMYYTLVNAQIDFVINDGMTVETNGGLIIVVSGDVIENNTGYLKGVVTSGDRGSGGVSSFSELTLGSGIDQITRITGTALSTASPRTFLRSYQLNNSGTIINTSLSSKYVSSGINDEHNGIGTPFIYKKVGTTWTGYPNNTTTANTASTASVSIPNGTSDFTISEGVGVATKIFLEGPYQNGGIMSTSIHGSLPLVSPYSEDPRTVNAIPTNAVDWILVGLRNSTAPFAVVASHSAFVNNNGMIIDDNGNEYTGVPTIPRSYNISIKQRNHLEIMTNNAQSLDWESN